MGSVKRIVSDIPPPKMQGDELVRMIQFEQNNPRKRLLGDPAKIDVIHAVAGVYRRGKYISLLPLPKFDRLPKSHRSFAARDDGHSPALRGGDFAVIDTRKREPVHGQLVLYVHGEHRAIVRLELPPQSAYRAVQKEQEIDHPRPWWVLLYGRQPVLGWNPSMRDISLDGYLSMADGPISEKFLRESIAGHVVGVLRTDGGL